ncbi:hypothetical protein [Rhodocyclus purpureus]|uniref:hypothetical protein n=1 Tax=Rhodocyclus purpureus TaxID=1067 RepID=UPI0019133B8B|nr:hypothetical protein [Rhodocyclus purpureus]
MNHTHRFLATALPAGFYSLAGLQLLAFIAVSGFLLWIGWDIAKVLWRFLVGFFSLFF